jgi:hypothetical protein
MKVIILITAAFIMVFSGQVLAGDIKPLDIQLISYPSTSEVSSTTQTPASRPIDINLNNTALGNQTSERINRMSDRKQYNKELYRFTEKPSDYTHAIQQNYIPW